MAGELLWSIHVIISWYILCNTEIKLLMSLALVDLHCFDFLNCRLIRGASVGDAVAIA